MAVAGLRARIAALRPAVDDDLQHLLLASLLLRLEELLDLWQDCRALESALLQGTTLPALTAAARDRGVPETDVGAGAEVRLRSTVPQRVDGSGGDTSESSSTHADTASSQPASLLQRLTRSSSRLSADAPAPAGDARHIDYGMAAFSALSAGFALMAYCVLWIGIGWEGGGNGAMMAAVTAAFFAAQDDPAPSMVSFLTWAVVASVVAGIYLFGIFPAIHDFPMLVLVLAAVFLPLGALLHRPKTMLIALPLVVNLTALLSLQNTYNANIQSFVNAAVAIVLGIGFAVVLTRLFRSVGAEWSARRLVRQGWRTLAAAADGRGAQDRHQFAARMLDLLGLLAPRLAVAPPGSDLASVDMLTEIRVGLNILQLRRARHGLPPASIAAVDAILADVAAHYRQQVAHKRPLPGPDTLRTRLDASLARVGQVPAGTHRDEALLGLIGLRSSLFVDATAPDNAPGHPQLA
ncbi:FUSC family protein [Xanthomonas campestris]|uniref:FUSC family protein n=1 Tax=Xanthomonas campestris TaxID=339 RepID=UPI00388DEA30